MIDTYNPQHAFTTIIEQHIVELIKQGYALPMVSAAVDCRGHVVVHRYERLGGQILGEQLCSHGEGLTLPVNVQWSDPSGRVSHLTIVSEPIEKPVQPN